MQNLTMWSKCKKSIQIWRSDSMVGAKISEMIVFLAVAAAVMLKSLTFKIRSYWTS